MDWSAVASLVAERGNLPAILLNARGEVLLVAPAAREALGGRSGDIGVDWIGTYVAPRAADSTRWLLGKATAGALRKLEVEVTTETGTAMALFDTRPIGGTGESAVLLVLERLTPVEPPEAMSDYDYEVREISSGGFRLVPVPQVRLSNPNEGGKCHEILHGRATPCPGCPLSGGSAASNENVKVDSRSPQDYVLTRATPLDGDGARVSVRRLSTASLSAMMQARIDELAARAGLSARERSIFRYLMGGRAVDEIAIALDIKPRTVKFHQANVLQKLGADSRTDLMRLVL
jgi:DNA-binding CsgD family transcriptional regulator